MSNIISLPNGSNYDNSKTLQEQENEAIEWANSAYEYGEKRGIEWINLKPFYSLIGYEGMLLIISRPNNIIIQEDAA